MGAAPNRIQFSYTRDQVLYHEFSYANKQFHDIVYNTAFVGVIIDNVCIPNGLETPVKLFSYPSYGAPIHWEIC